MINKNIESIISGILVKKTLKPINPDELKRLLFSAEYSSAVKKYKENCIIYRGIRDKELMFIESPITRISRNTNNIYNKLFSDVLSSWKEFPKRNHSFICTSAYIKAWQYSKVYCVFPKNGTQIAICPTQDIWISFNSHIGELNSLEDFNNWLAYFIKKILGVNDDYIKNLFTNGTYDDIINCFNKIENKIKNNKYCELDDSFSHDIINVIVNCDETIVGFLNSIFNPNNNHINLTTIENYNIKSSTTTQDFGYEVWFDNEALFIDANILGSVI